MCVSGQWKVKFELKPKKAQFTKLNGDLVRVQILYHQKYLAVMEHVVGLKAQVTNTPTPTFTHPFTHSSGFHSVRGTVRVAWGER